MTKLKLLIPALFGLFILSGCTLGGTTGSVVADGGLYKSIDGGTTWTQNVDVLATKGQVIKFSNEQIRPIILDPQDHNAIFAGSYGSGFLYSFDGGLNWQQDEVLSSYKVNSIAIDYYDKCKWVVATTNKVFRTLDCGRGWREMLNDKRPEYEFKDVLTDHYNKLVLYVANTKEILKSTDFGETWKTVNRFESEVTDLVMDKYDSRVLYATLWGGGVARTLDGGMTWEDVSTGLKDFRQSKQVRKIVQDQSKKDTYLIATKYGILKTIDKGDTWTAFELLTPPTSVDIWSLDVDAQDSNMIYYATDTTFYKSIDGGVTWKTSALPTTKRPTWLTVDFKDGKVLYLGTKEKTK